VAVKVSSGIVMKQQLNMRRSLGRRQQGIDMFLLRMSRIYFRLVVGAVVVLSFLQTDVLLPLCVHHRSVWPSLLFIWDCHSRQHLEELQQALVSETRANVALVAGSG
jgi:hypothetical protein